MILVPIFALFAGFILFYVPLRGYTLAENLAPYSAIALLACLDTVLGGLRAWMSDEFDDTVFVSGFFVNAFLAAGLVALGERLGLETGFADGHLSIMMLGAVVVFSSRIFNNLAALRRLFIEAGRRRRKRRLAPLEAAPENAEVAPAEVPAALPSSQRVA